MEEIHEVAIDIEENHGLTRIEGEGTITAIKKLQTLIENRLDKIPGEPLRPESRSMTIFRLPGWMHETSKELCEPKMVAIGPYHKGSKGLETMEEHKWSTLRDFLARNKKVGLDVYLEAMSSIEAKARQCYSETIHLNSDEFVLMLLLDGCFILEWLLKDKLSEDDTFFDAGWSAGDLFCDIFLLENQVPFFVLHKLLAVHDKDKGWTSCGDHCPLLKLSSRIFKDSFLSDFRPPQISCDDIYHLLHLGYEGLVRHLVPAKSAEVVPGGGEPSDNASMGTEPKKTAASESSESSDVDSVATDLEQANSAASESSETSDDDPTDNKPMKIPCISELHDAGVGFKRKEVPTSMFDISFKNGTIEMPIIQLEVSFIRLLWNLVAFEQIIPSLDFTVISSYLSLMDALIDTEKDITILEQSGIIDNFLQNAEEAATYFNQFEKNFSIDYGKHYFNDLIEKVQKYSESTWQRYRARLMQDYFSNPWSIISLVAASILLILTFIQTYYSAAK